jgi:formylglycine-generating enzyme required for sulfatase activity
MAVNIQLSPRQQDILSALSAKVEFPYSREPELLAELNLLKAQGLVKERLGSSIANLPTTGNLELHLSITAQGKAYLEALSPRPTVLRRQRTTQEFIDSRNTVTRLSLVLVPGGTFMMGSPPEELERDENEGPQHEVTVPPFLMGRYPVTQAQWRAMAQRTDLQVQQSLDPEPSYLKGEDHPVEQVSWYDAVEFCQRLSRLTGHRYRLPSEAEWEYACRARTTTPFHFGETITTDLANYCGTDNEDRDWPGSYGRGPKGIYRETTTPVNYFHPLANAFGLCDMHGNVWEWCQDDWHDNYEGAPVDGSAWLDDGNEEHKILRGGSWFGVPGYCRSAYRDNDYSGDRYDTLGFRVVCEARGL